MKIKDNVVWLSDNADTLEGFQKLYQQCLLLKQDPRVEWVLININSKGTNDSIFSDAVCQALKNIEKPLVTQIMTMAFSYGILFACLGGERYGWPKSQYMHHTYRYIYEHETEASLSRLREDYRSVKNSEQEAIKDMQAHIGKNGVKKLLRDFKKKQGGDYYFGAEQALDYNIITKIGHIEPVVFETEEEITSEGF